MQRLPSSPAREFTPLMIRTLAARDRSQSSWRRVAKPQSRVSSAVAAFDLRPDMARSPLYVMPNESRNEVSK
jgi:hypothetical protein